MHPAEFHKADAKKHLNTFRVVFSPGFFPCPKSAQTFQMLLLASSLEQLQYLVQAGPNTGPITPLTPRVQEEKTETQRQTETDTKTKTPQGAARRGTNRSSQSHCKAQRPLEEPKGLKALSHYSRGQYGCAAET